MSEVIFHRPFEYDTTTGWHWREIFADGFHLDAPANARGEVVSGAPDIWVFRGTQYAETFAGWTVTVRPLPGTVFSAAGAYSRIPSSGTIDTIELRNPLGELVMTIKVDYTYMPLTIANIRYNPDLFVSTDKFTGSSGDDAFNGNHDNDDLFGRDGDDNLNGHTGDDELFGEGGSDHLRGSAGSDRLDGGAGHDILEGGEGDDLLYWSDGDDQFSGGEGFDVIDCAGWNTGVVLNLGAANIQDVEGASGTAFSDHLSLAEDQLAAGALNGGAGDDVLIGAGGDDTLVGDQDWNGAGADVLWGRGGQDRLFGDYGDDTLYGEDGDDVLEAGRGQDRLYGGGGRDHLVARGQDYTDYLDGGDGDDILELWDRGTALGGGGDDYIMVGGPWPTELPVTPFPNRIDGGDGFDELVIVTGPRGAVYELDRAAPNGSGYFGFERVHLSVTDMTALIGSARSEHLSGGESIWGGDGDDVLQDANRMRGDGGDDAIHVGTGTTAVDGGDDADTVIFGESASQFDLRFDAGAIVFARRSSGQEVRVERAETIVFGEHQFSLGATMAGGAGADTLTGGAASDLLLGHAGDDLISGGNGADLLLAGGEGDDRIHGGEGDDILQGGAGQDRLEGGAGWDEARYSGSADDYAIISDGDRFIVKGQDGSDMVSGVEVLRFQDREVDLTLIVCDPDGSLAGAKVAKKAEAPLTQPPTLADEEPLVLPGPDVQAGRLGEVWRAGADDFLGRDPHRLIQPADVDWIW